MDEGRVSEGCTLSTFVQTIEGLLDVWQEQNVGREIDVSAVSGGLLRERARLEKTSQRELTPIGICGPEIGK